MTGLEKVIGKIIADAEADAKEILDHAEAECAAIREKYEARREAELEALREANDRECQALIVRAKSSAAMAKRNAILEARAAILNEAYAAAEKQIRSMNGEQYVDFLCKMLRSAMKRQLEGEADSLRLYGENISPAKYEVLLNNRDRDYYGDKLMEVFLSGMGAKLPPEARAKIRLAGETVPIDGGLVLRAGAVETNCSLSMLLAESRRETETRVSRILFGDSN
ncbi:MAG: hypothetical protein E7610_08590 [Ruminococcaceae bacterium]|nr:hypothetical protein [Oscillospiraceae bacterium]